MEIIIILAVVAVLIPVLDALIDSGGGHPFTELGRARWDRYRRVCRRKAELILRGYDGITAQNMADNDVSAEAEKTTLLLVAERVER